MLRVIEFGLLAVSLVVIIGLIVSGMRDHSKDSGTRSSTASDDQHGKTL